MPWDEHTMGRDDTRRTVLLRAHLAAGQWKAEAWTLADSLAAMLSLIGRTKPEGVAIPDADLAEYRLAQTRLDNAQKELATGGVG